jgi:hypothetical protein
MTPTKDIHFLIISDTFDFDFYSKNEQQILRYGNTTQADVILHCGNFSRNGSPDQIRNSIEALGAMDAELKLMIPGDRDATLDPTHWAAEWAAYRHCMHVAKSAAAQQGVVLLDEGTYSFTVPSCGAQFSIYASPWTPKSGAGAFQYPLTHDRFNPKAYVHPDMHACGTQSSIIRHGTDIVMTHGIPTRFTDTIPGITHGHYNHLMRAIHRVRPKLHCFGGVEQQNKIYRVQWNHSETTRRAGHEMRDVPTVTDPPNTGKSYLGFSQMCDAHQDDFIAADDQTLFVNAPIENAQHQPYNTPWLVRLKLPVVMQTQTQQSSGRDNGPG